MFRFFVVVFALLLLVSCTPVEISSPTIENIPPTSTVTILPSNESGATVVEQFAVPEATGVVNISANS